MNKFWYVVQNRANKNDKEYLIGYLYGRRDATEEELLEYVREYCQGKDFRLVLLIQVAAKLMLVNQIYPYEISAESTVCLDYALQTIADCQGEERP